MGCFIIISMHRITFQQEDFKRRLNVCCACPDGQPVRRAGHTLLTLLDVCRKELSEGLEEGAPRLRMAVVKKRGQPEPVRPFIFSLNPLQIETPAQMLY